MLKVGDENMLEIDKWCRVFLSVLDEFITYFQIWIRMSMEDMIPDIISPYLSAIAFLMGIATFILGFFMQFEFERKIGSTMKK